LGQRIIERGSAYVSEANGEARLRRALSLRPDKEVNRHKLCLL
jgi:hypothetical protein